MAVCVRIFASYEGLQLYPAPPNPPRHCCDSPKPKALGQCLHRREQSCSLRETKCGNRSAKGWTTSFAVRLKVNGKAVSFVDQRRWLIRYCRVFSFARLLRLVRQNGSQLAHVRPKVCSHFGRYYFQVQQEVQRTSDSIFCLNSTPIGHIVVTGSTGSGIRRGKMCRASRRFTQCVCHCRFRNVVKRKCTSHSGVTRAQMS